MIATPKQISFIRSLATERGIPLERLDNISKRAASDMISTLLTMPKPVRVSATSTTSASALTVGMYRNADGDLFKVQESATGNLYAKKLTPIGGQRLIDATNEIVGFEFLYVAGAVRSLTAEMRLSLDDAKAFGIRYGVCCVCGITLKDAKSVAAGIGPICATRL